MRTVKVTISSDDKRDQKAVPAFIERDRGAGFVREGGGDMVVNMGERVFQLDAGQRLVIDSTNVSGDVAYDRDQHAAYKVPDQRAETGIDAAVSKDTTLDKIAQQEHDQVVAAAKRTNDPQLKAQAEKGPAKSSEAQGAPPSTPARTATPSGMAPPVRTGAPQSPQQTEAQRLADADAAAQRAAAGAAQAKNEKAHSPTGTNLSGSTGPAPSTQPTPNPATSGNKPSGTQAGAEKK